MLFDFAALYIKRYLFLNSFNMGLAMEFALAKGIIVFVTKAEI